MWNAQGIRNLLLLSESAGLRRALVMLELGAMLELGVMLELSVMLLCFA